ncbi:MAG TPA: CHAT domain-containing protein [Thermoanaerobaculia bacterium]|nr:CHAT domain-containing protein [Thermoanaerobaculia bacterium]
MIRTVVGSGVIAVLSTAAWVTVWPHPDPFTRLVDAAAETRPIEGRLTGGFHWARYSYAHPNATPSHSRSADEVVQAASIVQEEATHDLSEDARRSAAVALLFEGKPRAALQQLANVASGATDARSWSDLAATRLHIAVSEDDPRLLPDALAAADAALHLQPGLQEARFNRALVLERLGIRDQAREAWQRYLAEDQSSQWATEARSRLVKLQPLVPFNQLLDKNLMHLATDPSAARDVARSSPLEARLYGETMILGKWAEKESAGDHTSSNRYLRIAREFGNELAASGGDCMLQSAVAAIDRANADETGHLLRGHLLYRQAQTEFKSDHAAVAQPLFISASREFKLGGSPLTIGSDFYLAHTFHALGNLPEARARERQLLTQIPAQFPAYRAQVLWHLGLGYMADGEWGNVLTALNESVAIFDRLREEAYGSIIKELLAEVYDHIGDPDSAWAQRVRALHGIGANTSFRLEQSLESAGRGAMTRREFDVAASLLGVASDVATRAGQPAVEVQTRLLQARVFAETANADAAQEALARARVAASLIPDAARADASAELLATDAVIRPSPADGLKALTAAIQYHQSRGRKIALPELFLHRARAYRQLGQTRLAAADVEAGIAEVERYRKSLPSGEVRWGILDPSYELFEEAIDLALHDGDTSRAFAYSERARSRELLEALQSSAPAPSLSELDPNAAIVEYVPFRDRLVILVARRDGVHVFEQHVSRAELERDAAMFSAAVADGSPQAHGLAAVLHRKLIEPIESELTGREMLVVIPGASLASLPFAALENSSGAFLVERYTLVTAPSAAVYQRLSIRNVPPGATRRLLVVANPITDSNSEPLPETEREAKTIAAIYQRPSVLLRENATAAAFCRDAANADVIHFATHGVAPMSGRMKPALLLAGSRLDSGQIEALRLPHTSVALLAACSSARGPIRSEGTISVSRAFLVAGVPSVIATLWSIDDAEAARFFPVVHKYLVRGISPARSLRDAQVDAIRNGVPASLWAAVQCIGS